MPSTRRHSYDLNFKLKIVAEAEAVNNNREIAREYGISESIENGETSNMSCLPVSCRWQRSLHQWDATDLKIPS